VRIEPDIAWLSPFARLLTLLTGVAAAIVALMLAALAAAVMLSARAALNIHRTTIDILHTMGASDAQIAFVFQRRISAEALSAGVIGFVCAVIVMLGIEAAAAAMTSEFLGTASLQWWAWVILALLPVLAAGLANISARATVMNALRTML